jgi:hypothetical protein
MKLDTFINVWIVYINFFEPEASNSKNFIVFPKIYIYFIAKSTPIDA